MDWKELERYRPIPRGGLKLLGVLFVGLLFSTICFFLSQTNWEGSAMVVIGRAVAYLVLATIGVLLLGAHSSLWELRGYWRMNVRSYDACFWIRNDEGVDPDIGVQVMERHQALYWMPCETNERGKIFLRIPLGGWFRRRGLLYRIGGEYPNLRRMPFLAWRIKVRQPIMDPLAGAYVEVIDCKGDRIPLTVSETLRFAMWLGGGIQEWRREVPDLLRLLRGGRAELAEARAGFREHLDKLFRLVDRATGGEAPPTGEDTANWTLTQVRRIIAERDEAKLEASQFRGQLTAVRTEQNFTLYAMHAAIVALKETRRFGKTKGGQESKEAKRIREDLETALREALPVGDHPLKRFYATAETGSQPAADALAGQGV